MPFIVLGLAVVIALQAAAGNASGQTINPPDLEGVWEAHTVFGPRLRGKLTVWRSGPGFAAEVGGFSALSRASGGRLQFDWGDLLGRFKGVLKPDGEIEGHWIQPPGVILGYPLASPVRFKANGGKTWVGEVRPLEDSADFFLIVKHTADGRLSVFLRNPQRNLGVFLQAETLRSDAEGIHLEGKYRGRNDPVELAKGSYDSEGKVLSLYFKDLPGSFDFTRVSADSYSAFYPRSAHRTPYRYRPSACRGDGWETGSAVDNGISVPAIEKFVQMLIDIPDDSLHSLDVHGILLARHGKLILDEYFHGYSAESTHDLRSAAKSLTAILAGVAMDHSSRLTLRSSVLEALKGRVAVTKPDPRKGKITVENLLTMSAGLDCDDDSDSSPGNEDVMQSQQTDLDYYHYTLNLPMAFEPGSKAVYGSALPNLLGGVIAADQHAWLPEFFRDRVAKPLRIDDYYMPIAPNGEAYMGGGVRLKPRDFLKLGQLMLDGGVWKGHRVLDSTFVDQSTKPRYKLEGLEYGFLWWVMAYPFHGEMLSAFAALGNGGQVVVGIPKLSVVFACVAGNYSDSVFRSIQRDWIPNYVLPMIERSAK